ncbi:MAG: tRNA (5-methylaminomethyl-2-thiouridine)(34)-methyltransferase MnmD [Psychroserpens sp.]|nr:tRNA (5-methylaminomethyl-2-thiouridine)(34)-methyltransferase MnmD [Psychroserpens sp.]
MQRKIITTADGSKTIQIEDWNEQYHSVHGAIQEANYVYLKQGLHHFCEHQSLSENDEISILEIGFGTGLNAVLTLQHSILLNKTIDYVGIEAFPVSQEELVQLNYVEELKVPEAVFFKLHSTSWEEKQHIDNHFHLTKHQKFFKDIEDANIYDIIYFDAFGARVQPELWTEEIFQKMYTALKDKGVLVTYSSKGSVKRALTAVGFEIERLKGPPGKRHMLRAVKR